MPTIKALGLPIDSRGLAQVSVNLTDFEQVGLYEIYEAVRSYAEQYGTSIAETELIGP